MKEKAVNKSKQKKELTTKDINETVVAVLTYDTRDEQANALGISRQGLYKRLVNHPQIEELAKELSLRAYQIMALASLKASQNLITLLDSSNEKVSLQASCEILDRVGITKENTKNNSPTTQKPLLIMEILTKDIEKYDFD